jgi:AraC-like DNA-binding protein
MEQPIKTRSDFSERLDYNLPDFPIYVKQNYLSHYGFCAGSHWHSDLEFIFIKEGSMDFFINGKIVHLDEDNGIFINSKRLHYGFSENKRECAFYAVIISPSLFFEHSLLTKKYFYEKFNIYSQDYIYLNKEINWQKKILDTVSMIYHCANSNNINIVRLLSLATLICADIGDYLISENVIDEEDYQKNVVWKMADYIHRNYDKKISLDNIAEAGIVCRSKCCQLFKKHLLQSPNDYLVRYRLSKSCELLRNTNMSISEIAFSCGFQSSSYFTSVFSREISMVPKAFRIQSSKESVLDYKNSAEIGNLDK